MLNTYITINSLPPPHYKACIGWCILFLAFFAAGTVAALDTALWNNADNHQKIYPIDSKEYQLLALLYTAQGFALPSTAGPWSEDELLLMISRIDRANLKAGAAQAYDYIEQALTTPKDLFAFSGDLSLEAYAHTNPGAFFLPDHFVRDLNEAHPMISLKLEARITNWAYGFSDISLGTGLYTTQARSADGYKEQPASVLFGKNAFTSNVLFTSENGVNDLDITVPHRAFAAFGGRGWSVEVGRERLSWGAGESGNFMIGSHIDYHTVGRAAFYGDRFKYSYNISEFVHPSEYYGYHHAEDAAYPFADDPAQNTYNPIGSDHAYDGIHLFVAHRLEWRVLNNVNLALSEAIMYLNEENYLPLEVLVPTMLLHNLYRRESANSLLTLEADWAPVRYLDVYAQFALDEFAFALTESVGNEALPPAAGYMLGVKTAFPLFTGLFNASLEGVLTDPYLYLRSREGADYEQQAGEYGAGFIVANRYITTDHWTRYVERFLGYRYGGDAVVVNARAAYNEIGAFSLGANLMFMVHGTHDRWTTWTRVNQDWEPTYDATPSTSHQTPNHLDENPSTISSRDEARDNTNTGASGARDAASYTTALSLLGSWSLFRDKPFLKNLEVYGQVDMVVVVNPGNISTNPAAFDMQFTLGLGYSF